MKSDTYILEINNEWCGVGEIDRIQELITYYLENGIKELTFKVINITQFMKEKQTTIKWITGTNPTISKNDEWRENNEWNKHYNSTKERLAEEYPAICGVTKLPCCYCNPCCSHRCYN